jgi:hypothetical protein
MSDLPRARLSKDGRNLLCSTPDCGVKFCRFSFELSDSEPVLGDDHVRLGRKPGAVPMLSFAGAWIEDDEVMYMPQRAYRRLAQGLPPTFRSTPEDPTGKRRQKPGNRLTGIQPPKRVRCPACRVEQIAEYSGASDRSARMSPSE